MYMSESGGRSTIPTNSAPASSQVRRDAQLSGLHVIQSSVIRCARANGSNSRQLRAA